MPKKKQVNFQNSIPGKYIPRDDPPPGSVFRSGANDNRFNAKMAEFLASSAAMTNENPNVASKSTQDNPAILISESTLIDSPRINSSLIHRRIVNMLDTLKTASDDSSNITSTFSQTEHPSQPITFGQLRQATIGSSSSPTNVLNQGKSNSQSRKFETEDKHLTTLSSHHQRDNNSSDVSTTSIAKFQTNKTRFYYSPSLEQLFEEQNRLTQTKKLDEQSQKSPLTVDDILAKHYSRLHLSTNSESQRSSSSHSNTSSGFYIHPSEPKWNTLENNQHSSPSVLNQQNRNRPPPPPYPSTTTSNYRTSSTVTHSNEHFIYPTMSSSLLEQLYPGSSTNQHLFTDQSLLSIMPNAIMNNSVRPPPPRYQSPTSKPEQSSSISSQQLKSVTSTNDTNKSSGFDRTFSRFLYGKDTPKPRRQKSKRKAFSDPDKKSVEEAKRTFEKVRRRLGTHINKTDKVQEIDDDDDTETESENVKTPKQEVTPSSRRRSYRQSELLEKTRESAKKAIVPANPILKRRIPSFLRVYSQAPSSNDILLQWPLFNLSELESFNSMMTRLYKNENLARVQLYEIYRSALHSVLISKTSSTTDDDDTDSITTPL